LSRPLPPYETRHRVPRIRARSRSFPLPLLYRAGLRPPTGPSRPGPGNLTVVKISRPTAEVGGGKGGKGGMSLRQGIGKEGCIADCRLEAVAHDVGGAIAEDTV